jgi:GT2 family glycosyltransferase
MIDVIIPVYKGLAQTRRCIDSVLANHQATPVEIVAVDDASPEADIASYLDELAAGKRITLVRNARNLGFVQSVNRGMSLHADRDVVLLNSDTEVANDWLDRLCRSAYAYPEVGTVTPFSNNATICSYPFEGWTGGRARHAGVAELDRCSLPPTPAAPSTCRPAWLLHADPARVPRPDRSLRRRALRARLRRGKRLLHARGRCGLAQRARRRRVRLSRGRR